MASRRSYADDLAAARLPLPERAMSRPVRVYGMDLVPTQPRCLLQHTKGVYKHSLQFQVGLSGAPVYTLHRTVLAHIKASGCNVRKPEDYRAVLQNLCFSFAQARADSVAYGVPVVVTFSLHRSAYTPQVSTVESLPGHAIVTTLTTALHELGLVEVTTSRVTGQLSSVVPTAAFLPFSVDLTPMILSHSGQVCVMSAWTKVKGEKKPTGGMTETGRQQMQTPVYYEGHKRLASKDLKREQQRYLERESQKLTVINSLASRCRLALCDADGFWRPYFAGNLLLHAVWNNGDTEHGGRNYCGAQNLPQRCLVPVRETLHLALEDGLLRPLVEVDYKNLHIRMLYALVRVALPDDFDCYDIEIPGWPKCPAQRDFLKVLLLALPNCGSPGATPEQNLRTAYAMARKQYSDWHNDLLPNDHDGFRSNSRRKERTLPEGVTPAAVIDAILAAHRPIAQYLYTGMGLRLQAVDGQMARNILQHFTLNGVPVICVHDSFMIWPEHVDELIELMTSEYRQQMQAAFPDDFDSSAPIPEVKAKKRAELPQMPDVTAIDAVLSVVRDGDEVTEAPTPTKSWLRQCSERCMRRPSRFRLARPFADVPPRSTRWNTTSLAGIGSARLLCVPAAFDPATFDLLRAAVAGLTAGRPHAGTSTSNADVAGLRRSITR